jgi:hypothetical protein
VENKSVGWDDFLTSLFQIIIGVKMNEPSDTEILEFLLNQFKAQSLKMNGESEWVFINSGFPMNRAKGKSARDAVISAMEAK